MSKSYTYTNFSSGFNIGGDSPIDSRIIRDTVQEALDTIDQYSTYDGLRVYIREGESGQPENWIFKYNPENPTAEDEFDFIFIKDTSLGQGGGGGGDAIIIADNHWFDDEPQRDQHFIDNPQELKDELMVAVKFPGDGFYYISQYFTEKETDPGDPEADPPVPPVVEPAHWVNKYALAQGPKGEDGQNGMDGEGVVTVATKGDLNPIGDLGTLYVVEDEDTTYRWDEAAQEYISVGGGGGETTEIEMGGSFVVSNPIGGLTSGKVIAADDNLYDTLKEMLRPLTPPVYTAPTLTLVGVGSGNVEIGENISPLMTPTFTQRDGGALEEYRLIKSGTTIYTNITADAYTDTPEFLLENVTTYSAQADYGEGPVKEDSEGNPDPTGQILAGTVTSADVVYTPVRRSFFGSLATADVPNDSVKVRGLPQNVLAAANGTVMSASVPVGARGVCFAYPDTLRDPTSITSVQLGNIPVSNFTKISVAVEGANGYTAANYKVFYFTTAAPFSAADTYTLTI